MKPTPFVEGKDLEPIPFSSRHCKLAKRLKEKGLEWEPHVGCFVWDENEHISAFSPFPNRIYFILNLGHFLRIFESLENMKEKLVWLPTWHQARLLCKRLHLDQHELKSVGSFPEDKEAGEDVAALYAFILEKL
jgi:hypothetical protein